MQYMFYMIIVALLFMIYIRLGDLNDWQCDPADQHGYTAFWVCVESYFRTGISCYRAGDHFVSYPEVSYV